MIWLCVRQNAKYLMQVCHPPSLDQLLHPEGHGCEESHRHQVQGGQASGPLAVLVRANLSREFGSSFLSISCMVFSHVKAYHVLTSFLLLNDPNDHEDADQERDDVVARRDE